MHNLNIGGTGKSRDGKNKEQARTMAQHSWILSASPSPSLFMAGAESALFISLAEDQNSSVLHLSVVFLPIHFFLNYLTIKQFKEGFLKNQRGKEQPSVCLKNKTSVGIPSHCLHPHVEPGAASGTCFDVKNSIVYGIVQLHQRC